MKKSWFLKPHIICIIIIVIHLFFKWLFNLGLSENFIFTIKLIAILTGCILMFFYFNQVLLRFYFKVFGIGLVLFFIGLLFRGFVGGLLTSTIQYPIIPDGIAYKKNKITIYRVYKGAFSLCCTYRVAEKQYSIFEKSYGQFQVLGQSHLTIKTFENSTQFIKITYEDFVFDNSKNAMVLKDKSLIFNK